MSIATRLTGRRAPAKRGGSALADSDAPALPATGAKRRCRVPLMLFRLFGAI